MPLNLDQVGLQTYTTSALCESVEYEKKMDEAMIQECDSTFGAAEAFDPTFDFSVKGRGDLPAGLVLGTGTGIGTDGGADGVITGVNDGTGTSIITNVKFGEKNDDFNSWEMSGSYYPSAIVA